MNSEELRQLQAPFKALYKQHPERARLSSTASGMLIKGRPACRVESKLGPFDAGLHPAAGGNAHDKCSVDLLLEALVSCAGVTFNLVSIAMGVAYESVKVIAECDADVRGALGVAKDVPVGLTGVRLRFEVDSSASDEQLAVLLKQTEKYCVVFQTLGNPAPMHAEIRRTT